MTNHSIRILNRHTFRFVFSFMSFKVWLLVTGQDQDTVGGGFNSRESFIGEMSQVYMFREVLEQRQVQELLGWAEQHKCVPPGQDVLDRAIMRWTDVLMNRQGQINVRNTSLCLGMCVM